MLAEPSKHKLRLFSRRSHHFAIVEDEIAAIVDWQAPVQLPRAPEPVMGVVGIHGRMLTVLDVGRMVGRTRSDAESIPAKIISLRGDEQLALPVDELGEVIEIGNNLGTADQGGLVLSLIKRDDKEIAILNVKELFASAIQGQERRRRRF